MANTSPAIIAVASSCIAGMASEYLSRLPETVAWPSRSETTLRWMSMPLTPWLPAAQPERFFVWGSGVSRPASACLLEVFESCLPDTKPHFAGLNRTTPTSSRPAQDFRQAVKGVKLPGISPHDLRHTHATFALRAGIHPKVVSERLGYATVPITLDAYSHAIPAMQDEAALIAGLVFATCKRAPPERTETRGGVCRRLSGSA